MTSKRRFFRGQDYDKLKQDCLEKGELFYDDLFELDVPNAMWLRPKYLVKDPRFFVDGVSRFDVVQGRNQGCWLIVAMANLTMNSTMFHHVVPKDQSFTDSYAGIFRFNIWQCGDWVEVVIDDRLPTKEDSDGSRALIFLHSKQKNEFWSALLEKAYAKLYGSYNELTSGWFNEAMVDFTGGIVERVSLQPSPEDLWNVICRSFENNSFMCVFMMDDPAIKEMTTEHGLVKGHAYSITKTLTVALETGERVNLIRLRNPWGRIEWKGPWSDFSTEWQSISSDVKIEIGLELETDGEFWISLTDFLKNFENLDICHLGPEMFTDAGMNAWESHFFKGQWTKGISAGGFDLQTFHLNPQYRIVLTESDGANGLCPVIVGLMQRNKTRRFWRKIGFTIFLLEGPEKSSNKPLCRKYLMDNFEGSSSTRFREHREIVFRSSWKPGVYCIIPSTLSPKMEGQFLLRVYSGKKMSMEEHEVNLEILEPSQIKNAIGHKNSNEENTTYRQKKESVTLIQKNEKEVFEYFKKIAGVENEINWQGLQEILDYALNSSKTPVSEGFFEILVSFVTSFFSGSSENKTFTKYECRTMIELLDDDHSGRMGLREFQILWRKLQSLELVFSNHCSSDTNDLEVADLRMALKEAGYNVNNSDLGRLVRKYSDNKDKLSFDDFVMCAIEVLKTTL